ncbi:MAG: hypothetical protein ACE5F8_08810, partial [Woeseiaceae bacterium]
MVKSNRVVATLLAATSLIALAGCTSPPDQARELENADGILGYVPADTPYVFAFAEPLPDDVLDVLEPKADEMMRGYQVFLREILRPMLTENDGDKSADEMQRMSAVADELLSLFSVQGMRDAGIDRDSRFVLFGHGLIPVARVQLGD